MKNNPVLDANLACISKYNPNLKYKILRIESLKNDISIVNTVLQEPNFMYNGVYLHNNYGAEAEAKELFKNVKNSPSMMHVLFGFGLGYLFQEFALKSKGKVFVYEPEIEILAAALEVVDFTKELSNPRVFLFSDFDELKKCYCQNYGYNSETTIAFLPSYKSLFDRDIKQFASNLNIIMGSMIINNNYLKNKFIPAVVSVCNNMNFIVNEPPLAEYKDIYAGKSAVIVSAGPSLDKNIEALKKYRNSVIVFSVGQAVKTLVNHGITPDFIGFVEANSQMAQIEGIDTSNIDLILEPLTYSGVHKTKFRNKISYPSHTSLPNLVWTGFANIDASLYYSSGTVSYMMLYSAKMMGFKNIILVGQDLAFVDGKCYAKDSRHKGLKYEKNPETGKINVVVEDFELFKQSLYGISSTMSEEQKNQAAKRRIDNINSNLYFVKGIRGDELPTTYDYASFIVQFEEFAQKFNTDINLYNTSLVGAEIKGFKNIALVDVLKDLPCVERLNLNCGYNYDLASIVKNIRFEMNIINEIVKLLKSAESLILNYDRELNNRKCINDNCIKYFKQLLVIYIDIKNSYCPKSRMFSYIQKSLSLDLEYEMTTNRIESANSLSSISKVYQQLKVYIMSLMTHLVEIYKILKEKEGVLSEMSDSKS